MQGAPDAIRPEMGVIIFISFDVLEIKQCKVIDKLIQCVFGELTNAIIFPYEATPFKFIKISSQVPTRFNSAVMDNFIARESFILFG